MLQELMKVTETNNKLDQISKVYQMSKLDQILKLDLISKVDRDWQQKTNNLVEPSFTVDKCFTNPKNYRCQSKHLVEM